MNDIETVSANQPTTIRIGYRQEVPTNIIQFLQFHIALLTAAVDAVDGQIEHEKTELEASILEHNRRKKELQFLRAQYKTSLNVLTTNA